MATMSLFMAAMSDGDRSPWSGSIFSAWPTARSRNIGTFCRKRSPLRKVPTETACLLAGRDEARRDTRAFQHVLRRLRPHFEMYGWSSAALRQLPRETPPVTARCVYCGRDD